MGNSIATEKEIVLLPIAKRDVSITADGIIYVGLFTKTLIYGLGDYLQSEEEAMQCIIQLNLFAHEVKPEDCLSCDIVATKNPIAPEELRAFSIAANLSITYKSDGSQTIDRFIKAIERRLYEILREISNNSTMESNGFTS